MRFLMKIAQQIRSKRRISQNTVDMQSGGSVMSKTSYRISVLFIALGTYFLFPGLKEFIITSFSYLQSHNFEGLRQLILSRGIWAPLTSIALMTMQSVVPVVPGIVVTITNAWIFGWEWGAFYSWVGALCGATLDFGIARLYGRPVVERLVNTILLDKTDKFFRKNGILAVFISRLTPVFPFKVISYGAGLTTMPLTRFLIATGIGQTPTIIFYSFLGKNLIKNIYSVFMVAVISSGLAVLIYYYRNKIAQYIRILRRIQ